MSWQHKVIPSAIRSRYGARLMNGRYYLRSLYKWLTRRGQIGFIHVPFPKEKYARITDNRKNANWHIDHVRNVSKFAVRLPSGNVLWRLIGIDIIGNSNAGGKTANREKNLSAFNTRALILLLTKHLYWGSNWKSHRHSRGFGRE